MTKQTASLNLSKPEITDKIVDTITQLASNFDILDSSLAEMANVADWIDARNFGVKADGATDDTVAINAAINAATTKKVPIKFPSGSIKITSTIHINSKQLRFIGTYGANSDAGANGTTFVFYGTGAMFEFGSDDGVAWDSSSNYNGVQGAYFEHIRMVAGLQNTPRSNGSGNYMIGSYAIKDWRGGSIVLNDIMIDAFDYGFWGIKSDYSSFNKVNIHGCHSAGLYIGARSDQVTINELSTDNNDRAVWIDRASHTRFTNCQFVVDGSPTINPIKIGSSFSSSGSIGTTFERCWFEHYVGGMVEAFVEIGVGDSVVSNDISFRDCIIGTNPQANANGYAKYFCKIGQGRRINFENLINGNLSNLKKILYFVGSYSSEAFVRIHNDSAGTLVYETDGTASPNVSVYSYGAGTVQFYAPNGRFFIHNNQPNILRDYILTSEFGDKTFGINFANAGDGNTTRFLLTRRVKHGTAAPTTATWQTGDYIQNQAPSVQGTAGSQYIVRGWACVADGTPGTWVEDRGYTGT